VTAMEPMEVIMLLFSLGLGVMLRKALNDAKEAKDDVVKLRIHISDNYMHKDDVENRLEKIDNKLEQIWKAINKRGTD